MCIFQNFRQELRADTFRFVGGEQHPPAVLVHEEPVAAMSARLLKTGTQQRGQDSARGKLGESRHLSGGDFDFDGDERLSRRFLALAPQRVHVELQRTPSAADGLLASAPVDVATGYFWDRGDEAPVRLALDCDDVPELHDEQSGREPANRQRAVRRPLRTITLNLEAKWKCPRRDSNARPQD